MATIYVGPAAAGAANGTSWANRYGSLNAAEDRPIQAGDTVYVGPGVYREMLTVDVSGGAGSPVTYIGDYDGSHTDGVGGVVRITGSDDDHTATRNYCVSMNAKDYRTFRGFLFDTAVSHMVFNTNGDYMTVSQCKFETGASASCIRVESTATNADISNCVFFSAYVSGSADTVFFTHSAGVDNSGHVLSNCIFMFAGKGAVYFQRVGGVTVKNCTVFGGGVAAMRVATLTAGQVVTVNNCQIIGANVGMSASALGEIVEDYNNLYGNFTARTNVAVGANSLAYPPLFDTRWFFEMVAGGKLVTPFDLSAWSKLINVAGTAPTAADMRGTGAIGGVRELGALEYDTTLKIAGGGGAVSISPWRGNIG